MTEPASASPPPSPGSRTNAGDLLLIIPAYQEALSLPGVLERIRDELGPVPVLVIDDGSRDETAAVARRGGARVIRHPFNLGYGAALQSGYKYALRHNSRWVVQMDADGQHLASEVPGLLERVRSGECDLAIGSRFLDPTGYEMGPLRSLGRNLFRRLARAGGLEITDPTSGFQALGRPALELFASDWFPHDYPDVDVLLLAHRRGLRLREHPVEMAPGWRESSLHSGWKPLYYCYKMLLSMWALGGVPRRGPSPAEGGPS